jgi:hypothetical protein
MVTIAVYDIDGVVADVRHRLHHLDRRPKDWGGFFGDAAKDEPLAEGIAMVHQSAAGHDIVWLTGRPAWMRKMTVEWLRNQGLPTGELLMRKDRDFRPARVVKVSMLRRLAARGVVSFVDDDPDVVASATAAGFPATLAEWVPRSSTLADAQERSGQT